MAVVSGGWVVLFLILLLVVVAAVAVVAWDEAKVRLRDAEAERQVLASKLAALQASSRLHASAWDARQELLREAWASRPLSDRDG